VKIAPSIIRDIFDFNADSGKLFWKPRKIRKKYKRTDLGWNAKHARKLAGTAIQK
jgi:hypothetical protein